MPARPPNVAAVIHLKAAEARQATVEHAHVVKTYERAIKFEHTAKAMVLNAISIKCLASIKQPIIGFRNRSVRLILGHLLRSYGSLTPVDAANALMCLQEPIDPAEDLSNLWSKIRATMNLSTACNVPISNEQVLMIAYTLVKKTGRYSVRLNEWDA